jgi:hypothetical protein
VGRSKGLQEQAIQAHTSFTRRNTNELIEARAIRQIGRLDETTLTTVSVQDPALIRAVPEHSMICALWREIRVIGATTYP